MNLQEAIDIIKGTETRFSMTEHEAIQALIECANAAIKAEEQAQEERNKQCEYCREPGVYSVTYSYYKRCAKHKNGP